MFENTLNGGKLFTKHNRDETLIESHTEGLHDTMFQLLKSLTWPLLLICQTKMANMASTSMHLFGTTLLKYVANRNAM